MSQNSGAPAPNNHELCTDSRDAIIIEMDGPNELKAPRPTTEATRKYLLSKPWLWQGSRPPDESKPQQP